MVTKNKEPNFDYYGMLNVPREVCSFEVRTERCVDIYDILYLRCDRLQRKR